LQPIWDSATLPASCRPGNLFQFSLRQVQTDLLLQTFTEDEQHHSRTASLRVEDVFRKPGPAFITITSGAKGTSIYIDGALAAAQPEFPLSAEDFNGRLVLGDSPGQPDSWKGQLFGFAIYGRQLEATQVFHNFATMRLGNKLPGLY
jgi:hypothetical protein